MSNLIVPTHIKQNEKTPPQATKTTKKSKKSTIADAYVKPEENLSLDPSKIGESVKERMPQPTGWRILLLPYQGKRTTEGGIVLTHSVVERENVATVCGYVLKLGPLAYKDTDKFDSAWCKEGDWVVFGRYAGSRFKIEEGEVRLLNDDEVLATIKHPDDIVHF
jgi:chaperonin GroES|tara:strand:- start:2043 stop:2534 length:492 start_codon:yes stop_codon:yes gene_type:complete